MTRRRSRWSTCRPLLAHHAESAHQRPRCRLAAESARENLSRPMPARKLSSPTVLDESLTTRAQRGQTCDPRRLRTYATGSIAVAFAAAHGPLACRAPPERMWTDGRTACGRRKVRTRFVHGPTRGGRRRPGRRRRRATRPATAPPTSGTIRALGRADRFGGRSSTPRAPGLPGRGSSGRHSTARVSRPPISPRSSASVRSRATALTTHQIRPRYATRPARRSSRQRRPWHHQREEPPRGDRRRALLKLSGGLVTRLTRYHLRHESAEPSSWHRCRGAPALADPSNRHASVLLHRCAQKYHDRPR